MSMHANQIAAAQLGLLGFTCIKPTGADIDAYVSRMSAWNEAVNKGELGLARPAPVVGYWEPPVELAALGRLKIDWDEKGEVCGRAPANFTASEFLAYCHRAED